MFSEPQLYLKPKRIKFQFYSECLLISISIGARERTDIFDSMLKEGKQKQNSRQHFWGFSKSLS
jgi:hypothetical protein